MIARRALLGTVLALGASLPATPLFAQLPPPPGVGPGGGPNPNASPLVMAQKNVQAAQAQVTVTKTASTAARGKIEQQYKKRPDWAAAEQEVTKAKFAYDSAVRVALDARRAQPDYKDAAAAKAAAEAKQRALQADTKGATSEQLNAAGDDLIKHATLVRQMESEATADPKIAAAKTRYDAALKQLATLKQEVEVAALSDPECMAADQQYLAAQTQLKSAQDSFRAMQKQEADTRAAAAKARRATPPPPR